MRRGLAFALEEIFVTRGGSEILLFVIAATPDHGDAVIVFEPFCANYSGVASLVGVMVPVTARAEGDYHLLSRVTCPH